MNLCGFCRRNKMLCIPVNNKWLCVECKVDIADAIELSNVNKQRHTKAFRDKVVFHYLNTNDGYHATGSLYGIASSTVFRWVRRNMRRRRVQLSLQIMDEKEKC